jgi:hypothetical protein
MKKILWLCFTATILYGCTVKLNGEASIMKQWDRPVEATPAAPDSVQLKPQGSVGKVK